MDANVSYAQKQLKKAENKLNYCKEIWDVGTESIESLEDADDIDEGLSRAFLTFERELRVAEVIIDSQFCIEQSAKVIFKLTGVKAPERHGIGLEHERVEGVLNSLPDELDIEEDVQRVIFLTEVWEPYYEASKYGFPDLNIPSNAFMNADDGEKAISDAEFCIEVANELLDYYMGPE